MTTSATSHLAWGMLGGRGPGPLPLRPSGAGVTRQPGGRDFAG